MNHTFDFCQELKDNPNLIEEIQDWLQFDHGPTFNLEQCTEVSNGVPGLEGRLFTSVQEALRYMDHSDPIMSTSSVVKFDGKRWSFYMVDHQTWVLMQQGLPKYMKAGPNFKSVKVTITDDTLAVAFKLRFL